MKRHKVKREQPEPSTSRFKQEDEHDLAYYIHDRVELMHQVFSLIKQKDLKAMSPACVRHISVRDLEELCTEELLGISSKRLLSILDGAEPPSDTESSSPSPSPELETISLDSISSDEEILSQTSKKRKHKRRKSKRRKSDKSDRSKDRSKSRTQDKSTDGDKSTAQSAARGGLTVLELLELQARARAIRAQLHQERRTAGQAASGTEPASTQLSEPDDDVEIKEEPPDVVEISSDDEKPRLEELEKAATKTQQKIAEAMKQNDAISKTVTRRANDLVITVPQAKPTRKIKLNRTKLNVTVKENGNTTVAVPNDDANKNCEKTTKADVSKETKAIDEEVKATGKDTNKITSTPKVNNESKANDKEKGDKVKAVKSKTKKSKKKRVSFEKNGSDDDEITLQLSDTEKMDLLEDFDRKDYEVVTSSGTEDSESSSSDSDEDANDSEVKDSEENNKTSIKESGSTNETQDVVMKDIREETISVDKEEPKGNEESKRDEIDNTIVENGKPIEISCIDDIPIVDDGESVANTNDKDIVQNNKNETVHNENELQNTVTQDQKSDGELSDRDSSEVEALDIQPEVVYVSDSDKKQKKKKKEKKKKDKKKKSESRDESKKVKAFGKSDAVIIDANTGDKVKADSIDANSDDKAVVSIDAKSDGDVKIVSRDANNVKEVEKPVSINIDDDDDIYEILELSDDSSCYEVEGITVSKEPTTDEIEALSARIDEIDREEVVTADQIAEHEAKENEQENEELQNISWKDRYLDSTKVKKVLTTANILNAMRKKNKELKRKLEDSKKVEEQKEIENQKEDTAEPTLELGSIEHYETLEASTKYVDPVKEKTDVSEQDANKEMVKDAKQLLKMYKKLLKYNDVNKPKDPNKKKKKKHKKKERSEGDTQK